MTKPSKTKQTKEPIVEKVIAPINITAIRTQNASFTSFSVIANDDIEKDDLTNPAFWVNVSKSLKVGDEVRVTPQDNSYVARLIITYSQGFDVRAALESYSELISDEAPLIDDNYDVVYLNRSWSVKDMRNGEILFTGLASKSAAYARLEDHQKALAR